MLCMSVSISTTIKDQCNCTKVPNNICALSEPLTVPFTLVASGPESTTGESVTIYNHLYFAQKLEARKAALAHTNALTEEKKRTWREVLVPVFMSSEESGEEDGRPVLFVKSLPWRATKVSKFLKQMDLKGEKKKSKRSILQTMPRLPGSVSTRLTPTTTFEPNFWGFNVENEENMND